MLSFNTELTFKPTSFLMLIYTDVPPDSDCYKTHLVQPLRPVYRSFCCYSDWTCHL